MIKESGEIYFSMGNTWLLFITMLHAKSFRSARSVEEYLLCVAMLTTLFFLGTLIIIRIITLYQTLNYGLTKMREEMCFFSLLMGRRVSLSRNLYYQE